MDHIYAFDCGTIVRYSQSNDYRKIDEHAYFELSTICDSTTVGCAFVAHRVTAAKDRRARMTDVCSFDTVTVAAGVDRGFPVVVAIGVDDGCAGEQRHVRCNDEGAG